MNEHQEIQTLLRECLARKFPLYEEKHEVRASEIRPGKIYVGYETEKILISSHYETTHLDLNLVDNTCFLLSIAITQEKRGKGYGRALYATVEEFALLFGSEIIQMTPSGWTKTGKTRFDYMLGLGYEPVGDIEVKKRLA